MAILYCVVARKPIELAKYDICDCVGNFSEISDLVLAKIPPQDGKMTYSPGNLLSTARCIPYKQHAATSSSSRHHAALSHGKSSKSYASIC